MLSKQCYFENKEYYSSAELAKHRRTEEYSHGNYSVLYLELLALYSCNADQTLVGSVICYYCSCVVPRGGLKKLPRTPSIKQIIFSFQREYSEKSEKHSFRFIFLPSLKIFCPFGQNLSLIQLTC